MATAGFFPRIRLMVWENTHNLSGGKVIPIDDDGGGHEGGSAPQLSIHLDGARLFNAVAASGVEAPRYAADADTVQFCFSKGLGAPVGSILCGPADLMAEGRYLRKRLGGGMRQVGVLAAAARIALARPRPTVRRPQGRGSSGGGPGRPRSRGSGSGSGRDQHGAGRMSPAPGSRSRPGCGRLPAAGIKINPPIGGVLRLVTHRDVSTDDVDRLIDELRLASSSQ